MWKRAQTKVCDLIIHIGAAIHLLNPPFSSVTLSHVCHSVIESLVGGGMSVVCLDLVKYYFVQIWKEAKWVLGG